jgi:hypothetical protein
LISSRKFLQLRSAYTLAIRANMEDRYRHGDLIELPAQGDVVVTGDLHGNCENFTRVLQASELDIHPDRHLIVQEPTHTCETSEDQSFLLHEEIVAAKSKFTHQLHIILGNHELAELTGREILKGGICYNILFREGMKQEYGTYFETVQELLHDFIKTMPLACLTPHRIFISHSTPEMQYIPHYSLKFFRQGTGERKKDESLVEKLVWGRDLSQEAADLFAQRVECDILVVGHTACKRGYQVPNSRHIILDSKGAFATSLHFKLTHPYTQHQLVRKYIQYLHPKAVERAFAHLREQEAQKE